MAEEQAKLEELKRKMEELIKNADMSLQQIENKKVARIRAAESEEQTFAIKAPSDRSVRDHPALFLALSQPQLHSSHLLAPSLSFLASHPPPDERMAGAH